MAWTSKSGRWQGTDVKTTTSNSVGPGAYIGHKPIALDPGFAPFGSTKLRDEPGFNMTGAGPGSYDPKLPKKYDSGLPKRNVPLGGTSGRAGMAMTFPTPAPGTYDVSGFKLGPKLGSRTMGEPQKEQRSVFRSSSAPSIPMGHQSYGYDEIGDGRLVRQGPKGGMQPMTGRTGDSAGPGEYALQGTVTGRTGFGFGSSERGKEPKGSEAPGPGHYVARPDQAGHIRRAPMVSSSFVSQSDNRPQMKGADQPGPGQYKVDGRPAPGLREQHAELQYFGSTTERFRDSGKSGVPGPGQYVEPAKRLKPSIKPFAVSAGRFQDSSAMAQDTPGPGHYVAELDSATSGPRGTCSILGAMGGMAFGSMERRSGMAPKNVTPAPGAYESATAFEDDNEPATRPRMRIPRGPSSVFKSQTAKDVVHRDRTRETKAMPPPGAYDPVHPNDNAQVIRMPSAKEGFLGAAYRFTYSVKHPSPAPGAYDLQAVTGGKRMGTFNRTAIEGIPKSGRPGGMGFASAEKRFKSEPPGKSGPAPGAYHGESSGWVKKTFNVHFGDL